MLSEVWTKEWLPNYVWWSDLAGQANHTRVVESEAKGKEMIARTWHGAVPTEESDAYFDYLSRTGIPDLKATAGNLGVYVLRRIEGTEAHFLMVSLWQSREHIRAFAGDDIDRARYYPEDAAFLVALEPQVTHYEVLLEPESGLPGA